MKINLYFILTCILFANEVNFNALLNLHNTKKEVEKHNGKQFNSKQAEVIHNNTHRPNTILGEKIIEFGRDMAEEMRNNPTYSVPSSDNVTTSSTTKDTSKNSSNIKGVNKYYVGSKGAKGQDLYVIKCHKGRSISGVWRKSSGLWMSGSTSFGHHGQSIDQLAKNYCR